LSPLKLLKNDLMQDGVQSVHNIHLKHHLIGMYIQNSLNTMDHCGICRTWIHPLEILEPPQILIPYIEFFDFVKGTFVKSWKK
jgi:hypothetical protein